MVAAPRGEHRLDDSRPRSHRGSDRTARGEFGADPMQVVATHAGASEGYLVSREGRRSLRGALVGYGFIAERGPLPAYAAAPPDRAPLAIVAVTDICPERRARARAALPFA